MDKNKKKLESQYYYDPMPYIVYIAARNPTITAWAKKNKGNESGFLNKYHTFFRKTVPEVYKNIVMITRLLPEFKDELIEKVKKASLYNIDAAEKSVDYADYFLRLGNSSVSDYNQLRDYVIYLLVNKDKMATRQASDEIIHVATKYQLEMSSSFVKKPEKDNIYTEASKPIMSFIKNHMPFWRENALIWGIADTVHYKGLLLDVVSAAKSNGFLLSDIDFKAGKNFEKKEVPLCIHESVQMYCPNAESVEDIENLIDEESVQVMDEMESGRTPDKLPEVVELSFKVILERLVFDNLFAGYDKARNAAISNIDEIESLKRENEVLRQKLKEHMEKGNDTSVKKKRLKKLEEHNAQLESKLLKGKDRIQELETEVARLQDFLDTDEKKEEPDAEYEEVNNEVFPKGTILIGGHIRWRNIFASHHPEVKVLDGSNPNFSENMITSIPLLLMNTTNMSHATYKKLKVLITKNDIPYRYVVPRYRNNDISNVILK